LQLSGSDVPFSACLLVVRKFRHEEQGRFAEIWLMLIYCERKTLYQPIREAVSYRGLFTAGWFGVREKHGSRLEIYDRLRASE